MGTECPLEGNCSLHLFCQQHCYMYKPLQHVVKDLSQIFATEALVLHFFIVIHLAFAHFSVVKLVPLWWLISNPACK